MYPKVGDVIQIDAYKSKKQPGDEVEICQGNDGSIVNVGLVLKVITAGGVIMALLVKILA